MPGASQRPDYPPEDKRQGGARKSTNETPVSSKEQPAPPEDESNTRATRPTGVQPGRVTGRGVSETGPLSDSNRNEEDVSNASGRDHPAESEHDHKRNKLHGVSDERTDVPPRSGADRPKKKKRS